MALKPRLIVNWILTALLVLSHPSIAGGTAGPPNPVVIVFEVLSAGGGSRSIATEALRDCPPLFTLDPPPLIALKRRLIVNRMSTALLVLSYPSIAGGAAGSANPVVTPVEVLSACGGSRSIATEALRDSPPLFAMDPPPLIALKRQLIVSRVSTALLSLSYPSIAGGAAGPSNPVVIFFEVLSACGGSRPIATEALRDCPPLFELEPRLFICRLSTALLALSYPAIAGGAAGPTNPVASVFEVLSAGGGS